MMHHSPSHLWRDSIASGLFLSLLFLTSLDATAQENTKPILIESKKIWDKAPHNAFTDLLRHNDQWYCVFREGKAHVSPHGSLRVLTSKDGKQWKSIALITHPKYDLRDAKITVTPDNRLMLNGAGMIADAEIRYYSMSWFSSDGGHTWDEGHEIGDPGFWLWRAHWHQNNVYTMGYNTNRDRSTRTLRFYKSADGKKFETLVEKVPVPNGCGEDKILFMKDGTALCLLRHETGNKLAQLGTAKAPYTDWTFRDSNARIGGPEMIQFPDGRILAATRLYDKRARTSLSWLDPKTAKLTEVLELPSGGDTSYAGMVLHEGVLWVSYYSSHEERTSIYLAKVKIPDLKTAQKQTQKRRVNPVLAPIKDKPGLPRVLLIGDSISMGYTLPVRRILDGKANVHRIPANGGPTTRGLASIDKWLGEGNWDLIHFNWGIHDLRHQPDGKCQVVAKDYEKNLRTLTKKLQATNAKLIWASTTPIPKGKLNPDRTFGEETEYNKIAAKVMNDLNIPTNDLHSYIMPRFEEFHRPMDLHYIPAGSEYLGKKVAVEIEAALSKESSP